MSLNKFEKVIFAAHGTKLKITCMKNMPFEVKVGKFEMLYCHGKYYWKVTETNTLKPKSRKVELKKKDKISLKVRNSSISCYCDDRALAGEFNEQEDIDTLASLIEEIKNENISMWLCSKSKTPDDQVNNICPKLSAVKENVPIGNGVSLNKSLRERKSNENENITPKKPSVNSQREPLAEKASQRFSASRMKTKSALSLSSSRLANRPCQLFSETGKKNPFFPPQVNHAKDDIDFDADDENCEVSMLSSASTPGKFYSNNTDQDNARLAFAAKASKMSSSVEKKKTCYKFSNRSNIYKKDTSMDNRNGEIVGFSNLGNTCYMNAVLQSLLSIPNFFQDLNNKENIEAVDHNSLYDTLCNLGILKYSYETLSNQRYALQRVKDAVSTMANRFSGYSQHDAHEFLCHCLDELKESLQEKIKDFHLKRGLEWSDNKDLKICYVCPVKENFESALTHTITCQSCYKNVINKETCNDFSLDIPKANENFDPEDYTTADLFRHFFDDEIIEDYTCEKCKATAPVSSRKFSKLPRVLVLHIKRYDMYHMKRNDRIIVSKAISVDTFVHPDLTPPIHFNYVKPDFIKSNKSSPNCQEKRKSTDPHIDEPLSKSFRQQEKLETSFSPIKPNMEGEMLARAARDSRRDEELRLLRCDESFTKVSEKIPNKCTSTPAALNKTNNLIQIQDDDEEIFEKSISEYFAEDCNTTSTESKDFKIPKVNFTKPSSKEEEDEQFQKALELSLDENINTKSAIQESIVTGDEDTDFKKALEESLADGDDDTDMKKAMQESLEAFQENQGKQYLQAIQNGCNTEKYSTEYLSNQSKDDFNEKLHKQIYRLVGVVNHHGENTGMGHYTSDNYDFKSQVWRSFNDSSVRDVKEHEVRYGRKESAYIIFYMHDSCFQLISKNQ